MDTGPKYSKMTLHQSESGSSGRSSQSLRTAALNLLHYTGPALVAMAATIALVCGVSAVQHVASARIFTKTPINYATCAGCDCWDSISVGARNTPGQHVYHSVYWNTNGFTLAIYFLIVCQAILWFKAIESLVDSAWQHGCSGLRIPYLCLVALNVYPNHYSWWCYLMYLNEKTPMYRLISHHAYFFLTEIVITALVVHLSSSKSELTRAKLSAVFCLAGSHLVSGCADHYMLDVASPEVRANPMALLMFHSRNLGLILPDLAHLVVVGVALARLGLRLKDWGLLTGVVLGLVALSQML